MNRALVGTLESAPPGTSAAQLRERLRAPVVLEQLRRADVVGEDGVERHREG